MKAGAAACTAVGRGLPDRCGRGACTCAAFGILPFKSFPLIIFKNFYSMKNVNKFVITDVLLWELLLCFN